MTRAGSNATRARLSGKRGVPPAKDGSTKFKDQVMQDRVGSFQHGGRSTGARPVLDSLWRGAALKCPACGKGAMFRRYLKVVDACPHCGEELHHHRADDAPPYFTIVIVGPFVVGLVVAVQEAFPPPVWLPGPLRPPLNLILALL